MRRSAFVVALAALAGCATPPAAKPVTQSGSPRAVRIVALGDSLAFGTGASTPEDGFIFRAYQRVREQYPRARIDNLAIGGSVAADVLAVQVPRLRGERADIVIVCVGGNDVVRRVDGAAFAQTYAAVVRTIRTLQPHAAIVCCGVPDVGLSPLFTGADHDAMTRLSRSDDAAVRAVAHAPNVEFADLYDVTVHARGGVDRFLSDDRFHPSDAGHAALAGVLAPVLLAALMRRSRR